MSGRAGRPDVSARTVARPPAGYVRGMSDHEDRKSITDREDPGPTTEGVHQEPRGNPEPDPEALEKGVENLDRVKPY